MSAMPWTRPAHAATLQQQAALSLHAPAFIVRLHRGEDGALLGVSATGELWALRGAAWHQLGSGLDPDVPLAVGYGRIAGRSRDGGLWLLEAGQVAQSEPGLLAPHAGLLMLAQAVIGVVPDGAGRGRVARFEPVDRRWREVARSLETVLPDARPVRWDPAGSGSDENGHVAVLGAPDAQRYRHGVLGDAIEATALFLFERHSLHMMAKLELAAPHVFEDIAPRGVDWRRGRGLLTVRSGPLGAQLVVVAMSGQDPKQLVLAALGEPIGTRHRWLSPCTDGKQLLAVHTPHIGGVLHRYRAEADRLVGQKLVDGVSTHILGQRELDVSAWVSGWFIAPTQDHRGIRMLDVSTAASAPREVAVDLSAAVTAMQAWERDGQPGVALALQDGSLVWVKAL